MFLFCMELWADFTTVVRWGAAATPLAAATSPPVATSASPSAACLRVIDIGTPLLQFGYDCRRRPDPEPSATLARSGDASASRQGRPAAHPPHGRARGGAGGRRVRAPG